jgi:hypothetical protein
MGYLDDKVHTQANPAVALAIVKNHHLSAIIKAFAGS